MTILKNVLAAPAFPVQAFPNGYPGYPMRGDSSQPSLADDHGHSLMGLEDQVTLLILFFYVPILKVQCVKFKFGLISDFYIGKSFIYCPQIH